jgi:DNA-binding NtrC family response regulator
VRSFLPADSAPAAAAGLGLDPALDQLERRMILDALVASDDNKHKAAELLGIGERTLWTKLKKHGI